MNKDIKKSMINCIKGSGCGECISDPYPYPHCMKELIAAILESEGDLPTRSDFYPNADETVWLIK